MIYEMLVSESQPVTLMVENASLGQRAQGETQKVGSIEAYPHKYQAIPVVGRPDGIIV